MRRVQILGYQYFGKKVIKTLQSSLNFSQTSCQTMDLSRTYEFYGVIFMCSKYRCLMMAVWCRKL